MNGMFANKRGRDLAKHLHIDDCVWEHVLDIVAILKTGRWDYSASLLNRLSSGADSTWVSRPFG
jgi:malate synthase